MSRRRTTRRSRRSHTRSRDDPAPTRTDQKGAPMSDKSASGFPVPDPTVLTTKQLLREIEILRGAIDDTVEVSQREAAARKDLLFVRIDAIGRATELRSRAIAHLPADNARQIGHLRELM